MKFHLVLLPLVALTFCATPVQAADPDISSNLVLYYSFDDAANLGKDYSGNGYDGVLGGTTTPTVATTSVKGGAAFFNRAGFSRITPPAAAQLGSSYTKSVWVYASQTGGSQGGGLIAHPTKASTQHLLMQYSTASIIATNSYGSFKITTPLPKNAWVHVVATYDESTQLLSVYKNGVLASTTSPVPVVKATDRALLIGSIADSGTTRTFDGPLDEVRVYSRALSAEEVAYLYTYDLQPVPPPVVQTAPVASAVSISGTGVEDDVLTATYTYTDAQGDPESGSTFRWLTSTSSSSIGFPLAGATTQTYTPTTADVGKYLSFEVTPQAATGTPVGLPVASQTKAIVAKAVVVPDPASPDITSGLTLYYSFDNGTALAQDSSGNGYDGVLGGTTTPTAATTTIKGGAAFFNRAGFSRLTPPAAAQLGSSYTKSVWVYASQTGGSQGGGFIAHPTKASAQHALMQYSTASIVASNSYPSFKATTPLPKNAWVHVVATYDEATQLLSVYKNGELATTTTAVPVVKATDRALLIGSMADTGTTRTFDGALDEVRVYSRALTPEQVTHLYNTDRTVSTAPTNLIPLAFPGRVLVTFTAVEGASDYQVEYAPESSSAFGTFTDGVSAAPRVLVTGLTDGASYKFRVKALKNGIWSPYSALATAIPGSAPQTAPFAENIVITGTPTEGQILTGSYTYFDVNDDPEGTSYYSWLRSSTLNGTTTRVGSSTTYTITQQDGNKYLTFEVIPRDIVDTTFATPVRSTPVLAQSLPRYYHVLATGQSLSVGGGPALSTTQPFQNLMLSSMRDAEGNAHDISPFIPLTGASSEKIDIPASNTYAGLMHESGTDVRVVSTAHGVGGQTYEFIKKGTAPYTRGIGQAQLTKQLAEAAGGEYIPLALTLVHGEYDSLYNNTVYDQNIEQLRQDYQADLTALTGKAVTLPLFYSQTSQTSPHRAALLQLKAHRANANDYLTGPIYQYEYNNPGYLHLTAAGSRDLGEMVGKVMFDVIEENVEWHPLMPTQIQRAGNIVLIDYHVPAPPIVFDVTQVAERASKGFIYWSNGQQVPIQSVEIFDADTIKIVLASIPATGNEEVSYAINPAYGLRHYGDALDPLAYGGNIRDSDARVAPGSTSSGKPLYNWAVAFRDPVTFLGN